MLNMPKNHNEIHTPSIEKNSNSSNMKFDVHNLLIIDMKPLLHSGEKETSRNGWKEKNQWDGIILIDIIVPETEKQHPISLKYRTDMTSVYTFLWCIECSTVDINDAFRFQFCEKKKKKFIDSCQFVVFLIKFHFQ